MLLLLLTFHFLCASIRSSDCTALIYTVHWTDKWYGSFCYKPNVDALYSMEKKKKSLFAILTRAKLPVILCMELQALTLNPDELSSPSCWALVSIENACDSSCISVQPIIDSFLPIDTAFDCFIYEALSLRLGTEVTQCVLSTQKAL